MMTMTGAQVRELAQKGFDAAGDGYPFSYLLVTKGDAELKDDTVYQVAFLMKGYTEETAEKYGVQIHEESLRRILCIWLEDQKTVSPDGNPWE